MTFEEFFKKKRIDLDVFEKGNGSLFSEFKNHFAQMGEKSFDHTKKYWFNNLRALYPLAIEEKTEKPKIENQLAEQTITESLIEERATPSPTPKLGFVPKFKAASIPKPVTEEQLKVEEQPAEAAPKLGFKPKFKATNPPKTVVESISKPTEPAKDESAETPQENKPAQPYKPRFNMKNIPPKPAEE